MRPRSGKVFAVETVSGRRLQHWRRFIGLDAVVFATVLDPGPHPQTFIRPSAELARNAALAVIAEDEP